MASKILFPFSKRSNTVIIMKYKLKILDNELKAILNSTRASITQIKKIKNCNELRKKVVEKANFFIKNSEHLLFKFN